MVCCVDCPTANLRTWRWEPHSLEGECSDFLTFVLGFLFQDWFWMNPHPFHSMAARNQSDLSSGWMVSSFAALAEYPDRVRALFKQKELTADGRRMARWLVSQLEFIRLAERRRSPKLTLSDWTDVVERLLYNVQELDRWYFCMMIYKEKMLGVYMRVRDPILKIAKSWERWLIAIVSSLSWIPSSLHFANFIQLRIEESAQYKAVLRVSLRDYRTRSWLDVLANQLLGLLLTEQEYKYPWIK